MSGYRRLNSSELGTCALTLAGLSPEVTKIREQFKITRKLTFDMDALMTYNAITDFSISLVDKGIEVSKYVAWHDMVGSTPDGPLPYYDLPGNKIGNFMNKLYSDVKKTVDHPVLATDQSNELMSESMGLV